MNPIQEIEELLSYHLGLTKSDILIYQSDGEVSEISIDSKKWISSEKRRFNPDGLRYLTSVPKLQNLTLRGIEINDINFLIALPDLKFLALDWNKISDVTALRSLAHLESLSISHNKIRHIDSLASLPKLSTLDISFNQIVSVTPIYNIIRKGQLSDLYIHGNHLDVISEQTFRLLYRSYNSSSGLAKLKDFFQEKRLLEFAGVIRNAENHFSDPEFSHSKSSQIIDELAGAAIASNPLISPPQQIVRKGMASVLKWYQRYAYETRKGSRPLSEAKLVIIGDPEAGKTTLLNYLMRRPFLATETTKGVTLNQWGFERDKFYRINIWDFGGQEIQSTVHQFFLTKETLYIIVLNARRDAELADRYFEQIVSFAPNSPILVVINRLDENRAARIDENRLKDVYRDEAGKPLLRGVHRISLLLGHKHREIDEQNELEGLVKRIEEELLALPNIDRMVPQSYFDVKEKLEESFSHAPYLSYDNYSEICNEVGVGSGSQSDLLFYLDILGTVRYLDNPNTRHLQILNPEWLSGGVYRILTHTKTFQQKGIISESDLDEIFNSERSDRFVYQKQHFSYLIEMCKIFNLAHIESETQKIFIPSAFSSEYPDGLSIDAYKNDSIHFFYQYDTFIPRAVMSSFIAKMFDFVKGDLYWDKGIVLEKNDLGKTQVALIVQNSMSNRIDIYVKGTLRRDLLSEIRSVFSKIHEARTGLSVNENVGLNPVTETWAKHAVLVAQRSMGVVTWYDENLMPHNIDTILGMFEPEPVLKEIHETVREIKLTVQTTNQMIYELIQSVDAMRQTQANDLWDLLNSCLSQLPSEVASRHNLESFAKSTSLDSKSKLKITLPIIPALLSLDTEISIDLKKTIRKIWNDIKRGVYFIEDV